ncbi:MAG: CBS domain-containing protein [Gemmatimonadetes bacterium]|nr:CBS domain-containing protein [Gemmatimonadota bacterium]
MRASDLMTGAPQACRPDDPVDRALAHMDERECGAVPVVDDDRRVVGIVTDRDILFGIRGNDGRMEGLTVSSCMTEHPVTVRQDDEAADVVRRMRESRIRRVPVVDDAGALVGIVAQADLATRLEDDALLAGYLREVSAAPAVEPAPER